jgi:trehalose 6-phosphate phosphatase
MSVVTADKGTALLALKEEVGASAVLYFGDDVTDEHVFEVLGPADLGVKVGEGETAARLRLDSPEDVAEALRDLRERRAAARS